MRLRATRLSAVSSTIRSGFRGPLDGLSAATKAALVHLGGGRRALKTYPADGPIVRVRRSTDNAEADIGPLRNGAIDAAAAATFAGAGDLFVVSSYDQSGAGRNLSQAALTAQPWLVITGGRASLLFDGNSDFFQRPANDFPSNLHTLPTTAPSYLTGPSSDFTGGLGSWLPLGGQAVLTASGGVAQLAGVSDYSSRAYLNFGGVLGKSLVFEMDIWSSSGNVTVNIQRPDAPFTDYVRTFSRSTTPRRIQLYIPNIPVDAVNLQITPWSGNASQIIYFDNVTIRDISPGANVGVTVAARITPQQPGGSIWSMRHDATTPGFMTFGRNTNGTLFVEHRNDAGEYSTVATASPLAQGATATVVARWDFLNQSASIRVNGVTVATTPIVTRSAPLTARNHAIGATNLGSFAGFFGGAMTPPIIINAHASDAECQIIEQALGATTP